MALGTIASDTIQDGSGNSTSTTNVINGSAKAWVSITGSTGAIRSSYNISSVTRTGTGAYTVNMTTAMVDANYCVTIGTQSFFSTNTNGVVLLNPAITLTSSQFGIMTGTPTNSALVDFPMVFAAVYR
jgi:hypothetical protein